MKKKYILVYFISAFLFISGAEGQGRISQFKGSDPTYLLTYDHGGLVLWGTDHFAKYLRSAVDWLDKYPDFKIGLDNEAYTYDFLKQHDTVLLKELRGYLDHYSGRFDIGTCTYGQPLSQFINEESNIRQIKYALESDLAVIGRRPYIYLMSEHAMHSQMPQILKGFGFRGAVMRTHFMMYGYNPTYDSPIGWWIGMDGSKLPAVPTYKGEGSGFGWVTEDNRILTRYPGPECNEPLEDFREKFSGIKPLLATRADDSGLRQEGLVKQYSGNPDFRWILLDEILPNYPLPTDEFKTLPDDFHVRMPWGYCGNEIWNMSRKAEVKVLTAERLAALEFLNGGVNHEAALQGAWKNLLVAQHHDIQICGILEDSRRFLPASMGISDSIIERSMHFMASGMEGGKLAQVTVFNPVSWDRREWISINVTLPAGIRDFAVKHANEQIPFEILSARKKPDGKKTDYQLSLKIDIPPLTISSFSVGASRTAAESPKTIIFEKDSLRIETPYWLIRLDKNGGISSLVSRKTGKALLQDRRSAFFEGVIEGKPMKSSGTWNLDSIELNNSLIVMHEKGSIGSIPYTAEMKLTDASPRIDFKVKFRLSNEKIGQVTDNKREVASAFLHEEKLRFKVFPALGIGTTGVCDLPFTIAETDNKYVEGNYWTALADGHTGVAFFNCGTMGSVHEEDGGFSIPLAYSMYYIWKTVMLEGDFSYEFALYPFEGKWKDANLHREAMNYNFPVIATTSRRGNGTLGSQCQPFEIKSDNVILSALYTEKGKPFIRFYESMGSDEAFRLKIQSRQAGFRETDLSGEETGSVDFPVLFHPWQIKTFRINIGYIK